MVGKPHSKRKHGKYQAFGKKSLLQSPSKCGFPKVSIRLIVDACKVDIDEGCKDVRWWDSSIQSPLKMSIRTVNTRASSLHVVFHRHTLRRARGKQARDRLRRYHRLGAWRGSGKDATSASRSKHQHRKSHEPQDKSVPIERSVIELREPRLNCRYSLQQFPLSRKSVPGRQYTPLRYPHYQNLALCLLYRRMLTMPTRKSNYRQRWPNTARRYTGDCCADNRSIPVFRRSTWSSCVCTYSQ